METQEVPERGAGRKDTAVLATLGSALREIPKPAEAAAEVARGAGWAAWGAF